MLLVVRRWIQLVLALTLFASSANAEEEWVRPDTRMSWGIENHQWGVQVQFWSQNRPGHSWGPFTLRYNNITWLDITCKQDKVICWGAWVPDDASMHWGRVLLTRMTAIAPAVVIAATVGAC